MTPSGLDKPLADASGKEPVFGGDGDKIGLPPDILGASSQARSGDEFEHPIVARHRDVDVAATVDSKTCRGVHTTGRRLRGQGSRGEVGLAPNQVGGRRGARWTQRPREPQHTVVARIRHVEVALRVEGQTERRVEARSGDGSAPIGAIAGKAWLPDHRVHRRRRSGLVEHRRAEPHDAVVSRIRHPQIAPRIESHGARLIQ